MKNNKAFGLNLKHLRNTKKLSQVELARQLNVSRSAIASYENNWRNPDFNTLVDIARYFEVSIDYLLGFNDSSGIPPKYQAIINDINDLLKSSSLTAKKKDEILGDLSDYLKWRIYQSHQ